MQDNINEVLKNIIQVEIVKALSSSEEIITTLVQSSLGQMVDENTGSPDRGYGKKISYLDWSVRCSIRDATRSALDDILRNKREELKKIVQESLNSDAIVSSVVQSIIEANANYNVKILFGGRDD